MCHLEELWVPNCFQMTFQVDHVVEFTEGKGYAWHLKALNPETLYRERVPRNRP